MDFFFYRNMLNGNCFCTIDPCDLDVWSSYPKVNSVPLPLEMDGWTKFDEGRTRHYWVIGWKQRAYWPTSRPVTYRPTDMSKAICHPDPRSTLFPYTTLFRSIMYIVYKWFGCRPRFAISIGLLQLSTPVLHW